MRLRASPLFAIGPGAARARRCAAASSSRSRSAPRSSSSSASTRRPRGRWRPGRCSPASRRSTRRPRCAPPGRRRSRRSSAWPPRSASLTGVSPALAIPAMAVVGAAAGYCYAVSLRLSIAGLSVALSLVISQGLPLDAADALPALLLATAGGLLQPLFSLLVWAAGDRNEEGGEKGWSTAGRDRRAAGQLDPELGKRPPRAALRRRARGRRRRLLDHRHGGPRLLDPADRPLRPPPLGGRDPPPPDPARGRHRRRAGDRLAALRVAAGRPDRPRPGADRGDGLRLRAAHRPVRALHDGDHGLRGRPRRHPGRARAGGRRPACRRDGARHPDRLPRLPALVEPAARSSTRRDERASEDCPWRAARCRSS